MSASSASLTDVSDKVATATSCCPSSSSCSLSATEAGSARRPTRGCGISPTGDARRPILACGISPPLLGPIMRRFPTRKSSDERRGGGKPLFGCIWPTELKAPSSSADQIDWLLGPARPILGAMKYCRFGLPPEDDGSDESPAEPAESKSPETKLHVAIGEKVQVVVQGAQLVQ